MNQEETQDEPVPAADSGAGEPTRYEATNDEKTWAMVAHLSGFARFLAIPLGGILGPLIVWMIKKDDLPLVDDQGKEALNFQITMALAWIAAFLLFIITIFLVFTVIFPIAVGIYNIVYVIIAAIKSQEGQRYRYPICIRFIK